MSVSLTRMIMVSDYHCTYLLFIS